MRAFHINRQAIPDSCWNDNEYDIPLDINQLKTDLIDAKKLLDGPYKDKRYPTVFSVLDYYKTLRIRVSTEYDTPNVSNAWLKMYELISYFPLITSSTRLVFYNAELPGSFLLAGHHYAKTNGLSFDWVAASIVERDPNKNYLDDRYRLVLHYPNNWLMDPKSKQGINGFNNGDTTNIANIEDFRNKILSRDSRGVDLYTSDIGIDVSQDYGNQELIESQLLLGSALAALRTLALGGNMVLKTFTYFEPFTLSLIRILSSLFDKFHICKPLSSRPSNSEVYLVGLGFLGATSNITLILTNRLRDDNFNHRPFLSRKCTYDDADFMSRISASYEIFRSQITTLKQYVSLYEQYCDDIPGLISRWKKHKRGMIYKYLTGIKIKPLNVNDRLQVREEITKR